MKNVASSVSLCLKRPGNSATDITVNQLYATGVYRAAASVESWSKTAVGKVVFRDVTEQRRTRQALADQLAFLAALLDTIPYPMFVKDAQARFVGCNRAYEKAFGIDRDFLKGKTVLELDYIPQAAREEFHAEDTEVIRDASRKSYELPITYADGHKYATLYSVDGFRLENGDPGGAIVFRREVTRRSRRRYDGSFDLSDDGQGLLQPEEHEPGCLAGYFLTSDIKDLASKDRQLVPAPIPAGEDLPQIPPFPAGEAVILQGGPQGRFDFR